MGELTRKDGVVVSCGGGTFVDPENIALLKKTGTVVCLSSSPERILERTKRYVHRPLLKVADPLGRIRELLEARRPSYEQAHHMIDADRLSVEETAEALLDAMKP